MDNQLISHLPNCHPAHITLQLLYVRVTPRLTNQPTNRFEPVFLPPLLRLLLFFSRYQSVFSRAGDDKRASYCYYLIMCELAQFYVVLAVFVSQKLQPKKKKKKKSRAISHKIVSGKNWPDKSLFLVHISNSVFI